MSFGVLIVHDPTFFSASKYASFRHGLVSSCGVRSERRSPNAGQHGPHPRLGRLRAAGAVDPEGREIPPRSLLVGLLAKKCVEDVGEEQPRSIARGAQE